MPDNNQELSSLGKPFPSAQEILDSLEQVIEPLLPASRYPRRNLLSISSLESFLFSLGREKYISKYGFVLLSQECRDALVSLLKGKRVIDVGSGCGFLAQSLADQGVDVTAIDVAAPLTESSGYPFTKTWKLDKMASFEECALDSFETIILSWPCHGSSFAFNVATQMRQGQHLVYQGEWEGCTANAEFFTLLDSAAWAFLETETQSLNKNHVAFHGLKDRWWVFEKK